jgi:predicted RNA binding protein YcfA (HicA-like mRNA interferase family)
MTTAELIRLLKKHGCCLFRNGSNHDIYKSPLTGRQFSVGRHMKEEVRTGTLKNILRSAGIELQDGKKA